MIRSLSLVRVIAVIAGLCASAPGVIHAESDMRNVRTHHLGILVGCGGASYREDLIVPLSFDGPAFSLGGQYTARTSETMFQSRLRLSVSFLQNRFSHEAFALGLELRPSWIKKLNEWSNGSQLWGGLSLPLHMTNLFVNSWDDSHLYWFTAHSLALVGEYHTNLPRLGHSVVRLEMPVVGLVSRPPSYRHQKQEPLTHWTYHISGPNESLILRSFWEFQSPMLQLMITRDSSGRLLKLGIELELEHCSEPEDIWVLNTKLVFVYQWGIG